MINYKIRCFIVKTKKFLGLRFFLVRLGCKIFYDRPVYSYVNLIVIGRCGLTVNPHQHELPNWIPYFSSKMK